ncbi:MAG: DUF4339 domain-containing protein [Phycisphaeraceae bacterium]|nr:DUF4339 domain-containing protein [Phycisphaeraceae bacterium]
MTDQPYYVRVEGKVFGPATFGQLRELAAVGRLNPTHEISRDRQSWSPAAELEGLFPSDDAAWYVLLDGQRHGPLRRSQLDQMYAESRIDNDTLIWKEGMDDWRRLGDTLFLGPRPEPVTRLHGSYPGSSMSSEYVEPHRGGTILALALVGFCCCFIIAIVAWVMANDDLGKMDAGLMDPAGRGMTQAGKIVAIVGIAIDAVIIFFYVIAFAIG